MPEDDEFKKNREPINKRLRHRQGLSDNEKPSSIHPIRNNASNRAEKQPRDRIEEADQAQEERGMGQVPDKPALGDVLHEVPCVGKDGAQKQQAEIAVPEGAEGSECR